MSGKRTVETEYIGLRRFFRNSYFASLKQILMGLGRCKFTTELIAVDAVAIVISLRLSCRALAPGRLLPVRRWSLQYLKLQDRVAKHPRPGMHESPSHPGPGGLPKHLTES